MQYPDHDGTSPMEDTYLYLLQDGVLVSANDDWEVGGVDQENHGRTYSRIIYKLKAGCTYTIVATGYDYSTAQGDIVVEVYEQNPSPPPPRPPPRPPRPPPRVPRRN